MFMKIVKSTGLKCKRSSVFMKMLAKVGLLSTCFSSQLLAENANLRLLTIDSSLMESQISWSEDFWTLGAVDQFKLFMADTEVTDGLLLLQPLGLEGLELRASLAMPTDTATCIQRAGAGSIGALSDDFDEAYIIASYHW